MKSMIPQETIEQKIFLIRRQKVMISTHLAELYRVETRVLIQAVKRNIVRFPDDFMFSLTRAEIRNLSQIVISSKLKHAPNVYAFTEQGVAMLSSVLRSKRAIQVNIAIMRAFVKLRSRDMGSALEFRNYAFGIDSLHTTWRTSTTFTPTIRGFVLAGTFFLHPESALPLLTKSQNSL